MSSELRKNGSTSVAQTSNVGFTSQVSHHLVVHRGHTVLYHTIPHKLCGCEEKDVHGLQSFVWTYSKKKKVTVCFSPCLQYHMLLASTFSKQNSVISLEDWVLVLILFTTATTKLGVNAQSTGTVISRR